MEENNYLKLVTILGGYTDEQINHESEIMDDLGLSSLEVFNMIGELEDEYGIRMPEKVIRKIATVKELEIEIEGLLESKHD